MINEMMQASGTVNLRKGRQLDSERYANEYRFRVGTRPRSFATMPGYYLMLLRNRSRKPAWNAGSKLV
jgi:hypothetical protein